MVDGRSAALMKGWVRTDVLMHPVGAGTVAAGVPGEPRIRSRTRPLSQAAPVTDAAINIAPDLMTKAAIMQDAVDPARLLGIEMPKVAALSAV